MENLIDSDDLSRRLGGVSKRTLDQWAYLGTGPRFVKIGRHRRYDPRDVEAWIESRNMAATWSHGLSPRSGVSIRGQPNSSGRPGVR